MPTLAPAPSLATALVARAEAEHLDLLTVAGRFDCPTAPSRWLHAAMLTTLVYRFGPPGSRPGRADRTMANGQCMVVRRERFLARGGLTAVAGHLVEDVALARAMAQDGQAVAFLDASDLLTVRMFESIEDVWRGSGRSLALPGVEPRRRQLVDLAVIVLAQVLPLPRLLAGRGDLLDVALVGARLGTLAGTRRAYERVDMAYWLSPLADPVAAVAIAHGIVRPRQASQRAGLRWTTMILDSLDIDSGRIRRGHRLGDQARGRVQGRRLRAARPGPASTSSTTADRLGMARRPRRRRRAVGARPGVVRRPARWSRPRRPS